jgi:hypothetical protein
VAHLLSLHHPNNINLDGMVSTAEHQFRRVLRGKGRSSNSLTEVGDLEYCMPAFIALARPDGEEWVINVFK